MFDDDIQLLLDDPNSSPWLCAALRAALPRDPVDAACDAEMLAAVLERRANMYERICEAVADPKKAEAWNEDERLTGTKNATTRKRYNAW